MFSFLRAEKMKIRNKGQLLESLLILLTFILVFGLELHFKPANQDIWQHLKTGEYILKEKSIPKTDIYSYTAFGNEWVTHEWLIQTIFYFFYFKFGMVSLIFLKAVIITLTFFILFKLINKNKNSNLYLSLILIVFAAFITRYHSYTRPHIFSWLFIAVLLFLLQKKLYAYIPLLTLIWANTHGSVLLGLAIIAVYLGEKIILKRQLITNCINNGTFLMQFAILAKLTKVHKLMSFDIRLLYILIISFLTPLANPSTYKVFLLPLQLLKFSAYIKEWKPFPANSWWFIFYFMFVLITIISFIIAYKSERKLRIAELAIFLLFAYLGFSSKRSLAVSVIVIAPILANKLGMLLKDRLKRKLLKDAVFSLVIAALIVFSTTNLNAFNLKVSLEEYPANAVQFIKEKNITGNMYNDYGFGPFILFSLYPDYKVFIDTRAEVYGEKMIKDYYYIRYALEHWEKLAENYDISFFVIQHKQEIENALYASKNWKLVYYDGLASIYVKNTPEYGHLPGMNLS